MPVGAAHAAWSLLRRSASHPRQLPERRAPRPPSPSTPPPAGDPPVAQHQHGVAAGQELALVRDQQAGGACGGTARMCVYVRERVVGNRTGGGRAWFGSRGAGPTRSRPCTRRCGRRSEQRTPPPPPATARAPAHPPARGQAPRAPAMRPELAMQSSKSTRPTLGSTADRGSSSSCGQQEGAGRGGGGEEGAGSGVGWAGSQGGARRRAGGRPHARQVQWQVGRRTGRQLTRHPARRRQACASCAAPAASPTWMSAPE